MYAGEEFTGPANELTKTAVDVELRTPSTRERLVHQQKRLQQALADVEDALSALDANPDIEKTLAALTKVGALRY